MAWHRPGDKPLSESMMVSLLTHIWVTGPQWVNLFCLVLSHIKFSSWGFIILSVVGVPLSVAVSHTVHASTFDQTFVDGMQECNNVTPDVLGSIYDVTIECVATGQYLYVYMESNAVWLTLLEVEVFDERSSKYRRMRVLLNSYWSRSI